LAGNAYNIPMLTPEIEKTTEQEQETSKGPLYQVIIHNDDVTPMDFVLHILVSIFQLADYACPAAACQSSCTPRDYPKIGG